MKKILHNLFFSSLFYYTDVLMRKQFHFLCYYKLRSLKFVLNQKEFSLAFLKKGKTDTFLSKIGFPYVALFPKWYQCNAGVLCTVSEKVKQFQFAEIAIFLDMEPIGGTFKVLYEINGEIRRSPFPNTSKQIQRQN